MFALLLALVLTAAPVDSDLLGKWDLTVTRADGNTHTSWLHVWRDGAALKARMVGAGRSEERRVGKECRL